MMERKTILIVDDAPENIALLNGFLKDRYKTKIAVNGEDALKIAFSSNPPDLILLDIMMPTMDGYEVCRKLKANSQTSNIPIIFVTGKGRVEDESKGFKLGCVDYITKPFSPPIVLARVKTHLELKQALEALESQNKELKAAAERRADVEQITRHDLKNPLTGVFAGADLMKMIGGLKEDQEEALDIIKGSAHKMLSMINSSLDLFKMEQNIYQPNIVDVDMIDIIHRIGQELRSLIDMQKSRILITLDGKLLDEKKVFIMKGEVLLLYSMMANLIKNAIEATLENEAITISLTNDDNHAVACIHNQGCVPKKIQETFFDKYVTARKKHGTGIGTYSTKLIVQTLGGKIFMTSSESEGTNIFIHLPADG